MCFQVAMKVFMPIHIRNPDGFGGRTQLLHVTPLTHQAIHYQQASYMADETIFGVL
jgi:hypothetical protein